MGRNDRRWLLMSPAILMACFGWILVIPAGMMFDAPGAEEMPAIWFVSGMMVMSSPAGIVLLVTSLALERWTGNDAWLWINVVGLGLYSIIFWVVAIANGYGL